MPKLHVLKFRIANESSNVPHNDNLYTSLQSKRDELCKESEISREISCFLQNKELISLNITPVTISQGDGGIGNVVDLYYHIVYENKHN